MMISLFEPDEFAQYPVVVRMLTPRAAFDKTLLNFIEYRHYYYGSPFYFSSALLLLPFKLSSDLQQTQLNMLLLRQFISVLPMIAALLFFTYIQTRFISRWKSITIFVLLLSVSAVVENNLWWHVDSLAVLFTALTFFFLELDDLRFGRFFHLAAVATGLAAGTKVIGLFFFLAVPLYLVFGLLRKKLTWQHMLVLAGSFLGLMIVVVLLSNPFLLLAGERARMIDLLSRQASNMSQGWVLLYDKGPGSWLPILKSLYGSLPFLGLALLALVIGLWNESTRLRHALIAAWSVPFGLYVLFTIAIKPTHFFLPILLPVFACLAVFFAFPPFTPDTTAVADERLDRDPLRVRSLNLLAGLVLGILVVQISLNLQKDIQLYSDVLNREKNEASLVFYRVLQERFLPRIASDEQLVVFRDVRMYFPEDPRWIVRTYWNSSYKTIEKINPDLIVLWAQRILDYTQESAQAGAINPERFKDTYQFYVDADQDTLRGYRLVYRDAEGLFFASETLYGEFFE
jgi:hypothetical protein